MWTLNIAKIANIANGSSLIKNESSIEFSFGKKIKFHQLYKYSKSNREYVYNKDIPQSSCLCEICKNVCFVAKALNKKIRSCNMVSTDPHSLAEKYTCNSSSRTCMFSENEYCYFTGVTMEEFPDDCDDVQYYEWAKVDEIVEKVVKSVDVEEAIELFNEHVKILKAHIFVKRTQNTHYNRLKENLKTNEFIIHVDYSENYKDKEQDEIQSAYFGHNSFSIFTACCYTRRIDGTLSNGNFTVTSEATDHSRIAAFSCINLIIDSLQKKSPSQFNNYPVFCIWSDSCGSQFQSKFIFALITHFNPDYNIQWYYNERHHGKGPMDGVGGTVKNMILQHIK